MMKFKFFHGKIKNTIEVQWEPIVPNYGMDVESELTTLLSNEIAREIDTNILDRLMEEINRGRE